MKRLFLLISVFVAMFFVSCSNDDTNIPDPPTVSVSGLSSDNTITVEDQMSLKFYVNTPGYLTSIFCSIESSSLAPYLMDKGLGSSFELVKPSEAESQFLSRNGIANGEDLYGATSTVVDLSQALPKLLDIENASINHIFNVVITDMYNQQLSFSFTAKQIERR